MTWLFLILVGILSLALASTLFGGDGTPLSDAAGSFAGLLAVALLLWFAALFNITVKRGRDIGVPGFVTGVRSFCSWSQAAYRFLATILFSHTYFLTDTVAVSRWLER